MFYQQYSPVSPSPEPVWTKQPGGLPSQPTGAVFLPLSSPQFPQLKPADGPVQYYGNVVSTTGSSRRAAREKSLMENKVRNVDINLAPGLSLVFTQLSPAVSSGPVQHTPLQTC